MYSHRRRLEAGNFGFRKKMNCTIHVVKTKVPISFDVYREADLRLCFCVCRLLVFPCGSSYIEDQNKDNEQCTE